MRFLIDAQLPPALARQLARQGHKAEHVGDCGLVAAADETIWQYAQEIDAIIVTKDEDFARRKILANSGPPVVWLRLPNTRRGELLLFFETILPELLEALDRGESLVEIMRGLSR